MRTHSSFLDWMDGGLHSRAETDIQSVIESSSTRMAFINELLQNEDSEENNRQRTGDQFLHWRNQQLTVTGQVSERARDKSLGSTISYAAGKEDEH